MTNVSSKGVGQKRLFHVSHIPEKERKETIESEGVKANEKLRSEKDDDGKKNESKRLKLDSSRSDDSSEHPLKHMFDEP